MRKSIGILTIAALVFTPMLWSGEEEIELVKASVSVGARANSITDSPLQTGEYLPLNKGIRPVANAMIVGIYNKVYYAIDANFDESSNNQDHAVRLDVDRIVDQKFSYTSLPHRLGNDPLTNLDVTSEARSGVFHTNFDPTKEYKINRKEFKSETKISIPNIPFLDIYANYRNEQREGRYQARTLSKCSSCHVVAKTRDINSSSKDYQLGGGLNFSGINVDYSYTNRQFREGEPAPRHTYLKKLHPELVLPVFDSRIQYDEVDGPLPFDVIPDTDKQTHLVKANSPVNDFAFVSAHFVNSNVKNRLTSLEIDSTSFAGGISARVGQRGIFNAKFSHIRIKNDDVFIDVIEPVDVAGPNVGKTFIEAYPEFGEADWTRNSALSRKTLDFDTSFRYRLSKIAKFRLNYHYKKIARDFYDVAETQSHTFKSGFDVKPNRQWKFTLNGRLQFNTDPFANLKAGVAPEVQAVGVPNPFIGEQFYVFHRAREANLTNIPTDVKEIKTIVSWSPSYRMSLSGNVLYRDEMNDHLNLSTWSNDILNYGVTLWLAPQDNLSLTGAYYFYGEKLSSLFAIPVLEGCGGGIIGGFPGTLTDPVDYDIDTHTVFVNGNYILNDRISFFANITYNSSAAKMKNLNLDANQLDWIPNDPMSPFDFEDISDAVDYSDLDMKQLITELGCDYIFNQSWAFKGVFSYYLFDDLAPYLYDMTGNAWSFYVAAVYSFR
jgi:hypothetical protein